MSYACELKEYSARPALCRRARTAIQDLPGLLGKAYEDIAHYLKTVGEAPAGAPFVAYYNADMQNLDVDIGLPVSRPLPARGDIQAGELPAGRFAICLHTGPYHQIAAAYDALSSWVEENGYEAVGVAYEIYLSDPNTTPEHELQTEVQFLLKTE